MARNRNHTGKKPLLDLLVKRFPQRDRDELYRLVMCSEVLVDGATIRDPSAAVNAAAHLQIRQRRYVSRAGDKLVAALTAWNVPVAGKVWIDAGASTGGFTDALLQAGAVRVHAVDVGYNQLAYSLRVDERVVVHERQNILDISVLDPVPDAAVCDLSFRSLRGVLTHILALTGEHWGIALLKPQFEAAAEARWGRRGTEHLQDGVLSEDIREEVIASVLTDLAEEGVTIERRLDSPVHGRSGNREVLLLVRTGGAPVPTGVPRE